LVTVAGVACAIILGGAGSVVGGSLVGGGKVLGEAVYENVYSN